jgi:hexosaminidase
MRSYLNCKLPDIVRLLSWAALLSGCVWAEVPAQPLLLMPWPANLTMSSGAVPIDAAFRVSVSGEGASDPRVQAAIPRLFERLFHQTGIPLPSRAVVKDDATLDIVVENQDHPGAQRLGDDERYSLVAADHHVELKAHTPLGMLRGMETFLQLVTPNSSQNTGGAASSFSIPAVTIHDEPRFPWRGLSLDVSRHFIPVNGVERTIDGLAAVKMNVLHWHLSDDQGFRVESKIFPKLQRDGSDGWFYTQAQIREIAAYARERGVRIVPEFDMPGHSASWLPGYPELGTGKGPFEIVRGHGILTQVMDPTQEYTYSFLNRFIGEMAALFPDEYFHIGGDEVDPKEWNASPRIRAFMKEHHLANAAALQAYFNQRVLKIVTAHGKHMVGWDEVLHPNLPKSIVIQSWRGQKSLWQAARQGYQGILSAGYYLDLMYPAGYHYSVDPMKTPPPAPGRKAGAGPAPGTPAELSPEQRKLILGGEAAMWEELATEENIDAKLWPRLAAIAERFWSPESTTDMESMYMRLNRTNHWLETVGLTQRFELEAMRQRLAGVFPHEPLDKFAAVLEPVKGYTRHAEKYDSFTPFNRLVDAIRPESDAARRFNESVEQFLAAPKESRDAAALRRQLSDWAETTRQVQPMLRANQLLTENIPAAACLAALTQAGLDALTYLAAGEPAAADWKQKTSESVAPYVNKRVGDLLIQIAPGVQKLVLAVPAGQ